MPEQSPREIIAAVAYRHEPRFDGFGTCQCGAEWTPNHMADVVLTALHEAGLRLFAWQPDSENVVSWTGGKWVPVEVSS